MSRRAQMELPPKGTKGVTVPRPARPLLRAMGLVGAGMFRLGVRVQGRPLLRLTTVGARTGKRRRTVLSWFPDGDRGDSWLVVASNGGAASHPGWAHNLAKNPDQTAVDLGDGAFPVEVELLTGPERETAWDRVVEMAPGYGRYVKATNRQIPIFRLTRRT